MATDAPEAHVEDFAFIAPGRFESVSLNVSQSAEESSEEHQADAAPVGEVADVFFVRIGEGVDQGAEQHVGHHRRDKDQEVTEPPEVVPDSFPQFGPAAVLPFAHLPQHQVGGQSNPVCKDQNHKSEFLPGKFLREETED